MANTACLRRTRAPQGTMSLTLCGTEFPALASLSSDRLIRGQLLASKQAALEYGATPFSSIASAFDFQHHVGSDPARELVVLKEVLLRECLLSRLESECHQLRKQHSQPPASGCSVRAADVDTTRVVELLSRVREASVAVVGAVQKWVETSTGQLQHGFLWHGENYLLKIADDLNFLAGVAPLVAALKVRRPRCRACAAGTSGARRQRRVNHTSSMGTLTTLYNPCSCSIRRCIRLNCAETRLCFPGLWMSNGGMAGNVSAVPTNQQRAMLNETNFRKWRRCQLARIRTVFSLLRRCCLNWLSSCHILRDV